MRVDRRGDHREPGREPARDRPAGAPEGDREKLLEPPAPLVGRPRGDEGRRGEPGRDLGDRSVERVDRHDPARTVGIDLLIDDKLTKRRVLATNTATRADMRDAAHALFARDGKAVSLIRDSGELADGLVFEITESSERFLAAEMVREKLFRLLGDELPYICAVSIDNFVVEGRLRRIAASIIVDKESHKGIFVGAIKKRMGKGTKLSGMPAVEAYGFDSSKGEFLDQDALIATASAAVEEDGS